jgi:hypothetical protein
MSSGSFIFGTEYIYIYIKERHYLCMLKLSFQKTLLRKEGNCYLLIVIGAHSLTKTNQTHTENTETFNIKYINNVPLF